MSVPPKAIFCYIPPKRITSSRVVTQKNPQKIVSQCDIRNRNDLAIISEQKGSHQNRRSQRVIRREQIEQFRDRSYNKEGQLFIIINKVQKIRGIGADEENQEWWN